MASSTAVAFIAFQTNKNESDNNGRTCSKALVALVYKLSSNQI
jgi:hypothetical protein